MLSQSDNWSVIDQYWGSGMIIKAWNQKDIFYWKRAQRQFPPCCWFCWHSAVVQHSFWQKQCFIVESTEFASCCNLFFFLTRGKKSYEDVNRYIYIEAFSSVTLWYFDVIWSEGNFISDCKNLWLGYFVLWTTHQAGVNVYKVFSV